MQQPLVIKQGSGSGQVNMQPGMVSVPITMSSSMSGSIPNVMTLNKPGGQNVVVTSQNMGAGQPGILPNVQILNMRPGTPTVAAQKSVATVSPRVVIGSPQVVGTRAAAPGITLQTLQSLQPGQQGHLLLKTENGQYQLLRVGPAPATNALAAPPSQTIRLSTVPAHPGVPTVSTSAPPPSIMANQSGNPGQLSKQQLTQLPGSQPGQHQGSQPVQLQGSQPLQFQGLQQSQLAASQPGQLQQMVPIVHGSGSAPPTQTSAHHQPSNTTYVKPSDNTKEKCRNFLANLLDLSSKEPPSVEMNVRNLIQELIDAQVEPEEFCDRLERLLNASPQPCLIGFLKKSLPLLRQSLMAKELTIEGIKPPEPSSFAAYMNTPSPVPRVKAASSSLQNLSLDEGSSSPELTPLLPSAPPASEPITAMPVEQKAVPKPGSSISVLQNIPLQTKINMNRVSSGKAMTVNNKVNFQRSTVQSAALTTVLGTGKSLLKDKERKVPSQFSQQFSDDKMAGDDDINDVAAMGGVNLAEESQRILGSTEMIGTQIRSCKEEYLIPMPVLQARMKAISATHGLEEPAPDVAGLMCHALHERLKTVVEKLAVIAQHRIDLVIKTDGRYETTQDVKGQLKFLEELDRVEKKRREDSEREILLRAAKSRSKNEDPEQAKLKAKAKEMQRAELEELRQREANLTALQAIGPRKKARLDGPGGSGDSAPSTASTSSGMTGRGQVALRTRLKRINQRDMLFLMETDKDTAHSLMLYKSYLK